MKIDKYAKISPKIKDTNNMPRNNIITSAVDVIFIEKERKHKS